MKVKIKKLNENAVVPTKAHATDAGFDLYCTSKEVDWDKRQIICHTGLAFEIPEGFVGLLFPRSSVSNKPLIMANSVGVIDSCYRGEVTVKFNITDMRQSGMNHYQVGNKVAQIIIIPYPEIEFEEAEELSETDRGTGGYGSTGR
nr:MAG TPA: dUTPase [Caudoviricetes sp.]